MINYINLIIIGYRTFIAEIRKRGFDKRWKYDLFGKSQGRTSYHRKYQRFFMI